MMRTTLAAAALLALLQAASGPLWAQATLPDAPKSAAALSKAAEALAKQHAASQTP